MATARGKRGQKASPADETFSKGLAIAESHRLIGPLLEKTFLYRGKAKNYCPPNGWAVCVENDVIHLNPARPGSPQEWAWVLGHCVLHFAFQHFKKRERPSEWNAATCCTVNRFLDAIKFGRPPDDLTTNEPLPTRSEESLYEHFCERGIPQGLRDLSTAGPGVHDLWFTKRSHARLVPWETVFADVLSRAVAGTIKEVAKGSAEKRRDTPGETARSWFLNHYPLLGGLAAGFEIEEDPEVLRQMDIRIGAVEASKRKIYLNSQLLDAEELRFVMAHEILHAALRHHERRRGRDEYLWNIACDFAINLWLVEMNVGQMPRSGLMLDHELKGLSAESIYDRIVGDIRRYRKHPTFRNAELGDMIPGGPLDLEGKDITTLDEFYRNALARGLEYHVEMGRGFLPAGLVEEIRAFSQPPIPWEVELARWMDHFIDPIVDAPTFTRLSRRQSSTPDIPRPAWVPTIPPETRTFGVIVDTSESMFWRKKRSGPSAGREEEYETLGKAIGAIVSYAMSRDVELVRVVFCDAMPYDQGYLAVEDLAGRVKVKGRGGTVLQPAIRLLCDAPDFPGDAPILIVTDGECDVLKVPREHAFLLPPSRHLPFPPVGPVFRID